MQNGIETTNSWITANFGLWASDWLDLTPLGCWRPAVVEIVAFGLALSSTGSPLGLKTTLTKVEASYLQSQLEHPCRCILGRSHVAPAVLGGTSVATAHWVLDSRIS